MMKPRLVDLLVCPIDKSPLELVEWESKPIRISEMESSRIRRLKLGLPSFSKEVMVGLLLNRVRKIFYPIYNGVPRLIVSPTGVTRVFAERYRERIDREYPEFRLPNENTPPGEQDILRTFSKEWVSYDWDGESYWNLTPDEMYRSMHFMLDLDRRPLKDKIVLEAGIGIGGIADYIARSEECELVGIDLSYAVDSAYKNFGANKFFHIVQASIFALPFPERTFDFVYSQGVIHHTFSTKAAFDQLAELPQIGGRLYVWVYSPYDERRTLIRRILMLLENIIRPVCWRLPELIQTVILFPIIISYIIHQNFIVIRQEPSQIKYGWRHALHAARDRFTPRYAHRHDDEEVSIWFRSAGYTELQCVSRRESPAYVPVSFVACTGVDGIRRDS
jgi:uncharacterized protein YbaR (Trm112 family)/2-polyprenyl-3-methyl-5-hydroxy-6-metoxy-1,4-benzoquinol methylase